MKLAAAICVDVPTLDRPTAPKRCKIAARTNVWRQHAVVRAVRRRAPMDELFAEDGVMLQSAEVVGSELARYWEPAFYREPAQGHDVEHFLEFAQPVGEDFRWKRKAMTHTRDGGLGAQQ